MFDRVLESWGKGRGNLECLEMGQFQVLRADPFAVIILPIKLQCFGMVAWYLRVKW